MKRLVFALCVLFSPVASLFTPCNVYATSANFTSASTFCVAYNTVSSSWASSANKYVGCVSSCNDTMYGMGIRFTPVTIPQGSTINSAYIVVTSSGNYTNHTVNSIVSGENADNASDFTTVANYQGRVKTSSSVYWMGIGSWNNGVDYVSPDITNIVQEIVSRGGWSSGNSMVVFWQDHTALSSQSCGIGSIIRGGNTIKLVVDYTSPETVVAPTITVVGASNVGSTSATLNVFVNDDGHDTSGVALRFGYDASSHSADFNAYPTIAAWSSANYSTWNVYSIQLTGLSASTPYYFNAQAQNSAGTVTGDELTFTTPALSAMSPSNFVLLPEETQVSLQWSLPTGYSSCVVRYQPNTIPTSNTSGTLLYSGSDTYCSHTGLASGMTYGYTVWAVEGTTWSTATSGVVTTKGTSSSTSLATPVTPANWFIDTDYTTMSGTFIYPIVNNISDSLQMPRNTAWFIWAMCFAMFLGFVVWSASRSMVALTLAVMVGIWIGTGQHILPLYMAFLTAIFGFGIIVVRERL